MGNQTQSTTEAYKIRLSENALKNIDEVTNYIAVVDSSPMNAIRVGDSFYDSFDRIKQRPFAYRVSVNTNKVENVSPKSLL